MVGTTLTYIWHTYKYFSLVPLTMHKFICTSLCINIPIHNNIWFGFWVACSIFYFIFSSNPKKNIIFWAACKKWNICDNLQKYLESLNKVLQIHICRPLLMLTLMSSLLFNNACLTSNMHTLIGMGDQQTAPTSSGHSSLLLVVTTLSSNLANESHWMWPVLVEPVHRWSTPIGVEVPKKPPTSVALVRFGG